MKLATFQNARGEQRIGAVDTASQTVLDLQAAHQQLKGKDSPWLGRMLDLIDGGEPALALAREIEAQAAGAGPHRGPLASVKLLAPVPRPRQIRDFNNAEDHWRDAFGGLTMLSVRLTGKTPPPRSEIKVDIPEVNYTQPIFYISNRFNVVGTDAEVTWPRYCEWFDYEAEFGFFIGKTGKDIPEKDATGHIFGYTVFNDFSARDKQLREMQGKMGPTKGKSFDTGNAMGPWIVTRDEIPDPRKLAVEIRVNGEVWKRTSSSCMVHSFEKMIAYVSEAETLHAGEFFGSGTMAGGCCLEIDRWIKDGDTVEIEFEKLGVLRNRVVRAK
jgi:2-keto-4-pentenoate hydratase/2-oxohepta-3-ene-1,7-dioic acid hydratase in catechol pathway